MPRAVTAVNYTVKQLSTTALNEIVAHTFQKSALGAAARNEIARRQENDPVNLLRAKLDEYWTQDGLTDELVQIGDDLEGIYEDLSDGQV